MDSMPDGIAPFPQKPEEFATDDRISFSKLDGVWILEDENGQEWEYNDTVGRWHQKIDEEEVRAYQAAYATTPDPETAEPSNSRKRKATDRETKKTPEQPENRAIYVTGLPLDVTMDELEEVFTRYGGLIAEGVDDKKRIKMYMDDEGNFKGEALIVYFRPESVNQAITLLHDTSFRGDARSGNISVAAADLSYKKQKTGGPAPVHNRNEKRLRQKKHEEMAKRTSEWSDDEPSTTPPPVSTSKWDKVVVMKHMFTLEELEKDAAAYLEIKEEVREEAATCGEVTNVVLFDKEPEGIMTVRFKKPEDAAKWVQKSGGRKFSNREVVSYIADSRPRFKKSGRGTESDQEEEMERLEKFGEELEAEAKANEKGAEIENGQKED